MAARKQPTHAADQGASEFATSVLIPFMGA